MMKNRILRLGLILAVLIVALDQASKQWIVFDVMQPPHIIPLTSFFNLVMVWNRGVSFGIFDGDSAMNVWVLSILALAIVGFLLVWLSRASKTWVAVAIGLVVGGAVGNVIDRIRFGAVADFLDFYIADFHWPAFNVADAGITVGAIMLILDSLFGGDEELKIETEQDSEDR